MELSQADVNGLVEKRIAKLRRQYGREMTLLLQLCAALAGECARLRWQLRVDRRNQKGRH